MLHAAAALGDLYEEEVCDGEQQMAGKPGAGLPVVHAPGRAWRSALPLRGGLSLDARVVRGTRHQGCIVLAGTGGSRRGGTGGEELAVHFSSRDSVRYLQWRDRALQMGSTLALTMKLEDQNTPDPSLAQATQAAVCVQCLWSRLAGDRASTGKYTPPACTTIHHTPRHPLLTTGGGTSVY
uniref:Uncharacterized protein n=1 Tax=Ditylenchus dipsaci TaxID=166011 RepID=A0A915DUE0_9BILA